MIVIIFSPLPLVTKIKSRPLVEKGCYHTIAQFQSLRLKSDHYWTVWWRDEISLTKNNDLELRFIVDVLAQFEHPGPLVELSDLCILLANQKS